MLKEFKDFAMRGNMLDLAVGIILGAAFGAIIASLVSDIIMPPIGMMLGQVDFSNLFVALDGGTYATIADAKTVKAPTLNYGIFINTIIEFLIIAFAVFLLVRQINRLKGPAPEPADRECPFCVSKISLKATRCPFCTAELRGA